MHWCFSDIIFVVLVISLETTYTHPWAVSEAIGYQGWRLMGSFGDGSCLVLS